MGGVLKWAGRYGSGRISMQTLKPLASGLSLYGDPESSETLMFVCNQVAKSRESLMFVCLQKDAKQCCEATKLDRTHCAGLRPSVSDQHNEYDRALWHHRIVWRLFGDKQTSKSDET